MSNVSEKLVTVAENVPKVYEAGKKAEYDRFWDTHQINGTRQNYPYAFAGPCWTDELYNPKYEIIVTRMATFLFAYNSAITNTKVPITIDSTNASTVFVSCSRLEKIPSLKVTENTVFTSWFSGCTALTEVNFTEDSVIAKNINFQDSPLILESALSVLNALKNYTGTSNEFAYSVSFSSTTKGYLNNAGAIFNGMTWTDYLASIGWNY